MVKVVGTHGNLVNIEMLGVQEVILRLKNLGMQIEGAADMGVLKAGGFIQDEVKEAISGNRPNISPRSVDTGLLVNSIEANKVGKARVVVKSRGDTYPGTTVTTTDTALWMEYGVGEKNIEPRKHFRNTANNGTNIDKVKELLKWHVKDVVK